MPGAILHANALVLCPHTGAAKPNAPVARVTVSGQPVVTLATVYSITNCTLPPNSGGPCATAQWKSGATHVRVLGQIVAIETGTSLCAPPPVPLQPRTVQHRVFAS
jgi:hypothetical protein